VRHDVLNSRCTVLIVLMVGPFVSCIYHNDVFQANTSSRSNAESRKSNRSMATTPGSGAARSHSTGRSHSRSSGLSDKAGRNKKKMDWFSEGDPFNSHITCNVSGLSLKANSAFRCVLESTTGRSDLPALLIVRVCALLYLILYYGI